MRLLIQIKIIQLYLKYFAPFINIASKQLVYENKE